MIFLFPYFSFAMNQRRPTYELNALSVVENVIVALRSHTDGQDDPECQPLAVRSHHGPPVPTCVSPTAPRIAQSSASAVACSPPPQCFLRRRPPRSRGQSSARARRGGGGPHPPTPLAPPAPGA
jgi:hypothetical protein